MGVDLRIQFSGYVEVMHNLLEIATHEGRSQPATADDIGETSGKGLHINSEIYDVAYSHLSCGDCDWTMDAGRRSSETFTGKTILKQLSLASNHNDIRQLHHHCDHKGLPHRLPSLPSYLIAFS